MRSYFFELELRTRGCEPAWFLEQGSALARGFLRAIGDRPGEHPGFVLKTGTSDMNVVVSACGCPVVASRASCAEFSIRGAGGSPRR